jgi:hypothetical protein
MGSGFSNGSWLSCSLFAPIAHLSPENLLTCHLIYQEGNIIMGVPDFEAIKQTNVYSVDYWSARDLAPLLGYAQWRRFEDAIKRAKTSCETNGDIVENHFVSIGKMVRLGSGAEREIDDYALSKCPEE